MYYTFGSPIELTDSQPDRDTLKASLADAAQNTQILAFKNLGSLKNYLATLKSKDGEAQVGTRPIFAIEVGAHKGKPDIHKLPDGRSITGRLFDTENVTVKGAMLRQMDPKFKDNVVDMDLALKDLASTVGTVDGIKVGDSPASSEEEAQADALTPPKSPEHKSSVEQKNKEESKTKDKPSLFSKLSNILFSKWVQIPMLALMFGTSGSAFEVMLALSKVGVPIVYPFAFELAIAAGLGIASYAIGNAMWAGLKAAYGAIRSRRNDDSGNTAPENGTDKESDVSPELVEKLERLNEVTSEVAAQAGNDADASDKVVPIEHARKAKEAKPAPVPTATADEDLQPCCRSKPKK